MMLHKKLDMVILVFTAYEAFAFMYGVLPFYQNIDISLVALLWTLGTISNVCDLCLIGLPSLNALLTPKQTLVKGI